MADQLRRTGWSNFGKLGVKLTTLTPEQAAYLSIDVAGPYKPENYRY